MTTDRTQPDSDALLDWLATPVPGLSLIHFDSHAVLDPLIARVIAANPVREIHRVTYQPRLPDTARDLAEECRRAGGVVPVIFLIPLTGSPDKSTAKAEAEFWKILNSTRELLGQVPAQIILCLDGASRPFAFSHARDLISWCSPRFSFTGVRALGVSDISKSPEVSARDAFAAAPASTWATLRPLWERALARPGGVTSADLRTLLLPLMRFAVGSGRVTLARRLREEASGIVFPDDLAALWILLCGGLAMVEGGVQSARDRYAESLAIYDKLAAADPGNTEWQRGVSISHNFLGNVAIAQGDLDEAARHYAASQAASEKLAAADPGNTELQRDLSVSHLKLGDVARAQGRLDEAAHRYADGLAISGELAAADPGNMGWQRDLSISHNRLGDVAHTQGRLDEATRRYSDGLAIMEKLAAADPGNTEWQRDLSISHERLGNVALAQGRLDEAARRYADSLAVHEKLAAADPGNTQWQRDLSIGHHKLGDVALAQGRMDEAASRYAAGLAIRNKLAADDPGNTEWQRDLSVSHYNLGDVARAQGKLEEAARHYGDDLAIAGKLAAADPGNTQWQRDLYVSHWNLADLAEKLGDPAAARRQWQAAHDALDGIARRGLHLSPEDRESLKQLKDKLATPLAE